jgi:glutaconate CoA-transferase subunit B
LGSAADLDVLVSDPDTSELVLTAVHPGVCAEQVRNATGWELRVAPNLEITPQPTASELTALRDLQARTAAAQGGAAGGE